MYDNWDLNRSCQSNGWMGNHKWSQFWTRWQSIFTKSDTFFLSDSSFLVRACLPVSIYRGPMNWDRELSESQSHVTNRRVESMAGSFAQYHFSHEGMSDEVMCYRGASRLPFRVIQLALTEAPPIPFPSRYQSIRQPEISDFGLDPKQDWILVFQSNLSTLFANNFPISHALPYFPGDEAALNYRRFYEKWSGEFEETRPCSEIACSLFPNLISHHRCFKSVSHFPALT